MIQARETLINVPKALSQRKILITKTDKGLMKVADYLISPTREIHSDKLYMYHVGTVCREVGMV